MEINTLKSNDISKSTAHLQPVIWEKANTILMQKAIAEFAHETIINPIFIKASDEYQLSTPNGNFAYGFKAHKRALNHWQIDKNSIYKKNVEGNKVSLCLINFILEFKAVLEIPTDLLPTYLEEINTTLYTTAYKIANEKHTSSDLALQDYQTIEHAMNEGHPCFLANSGKNGFSSTDFLQYAPEVNAPVKLLWVAGHKSRAHFSCVDYINYETFIQNELDIDTIINFQSTIAELEVNPEDYYLFPVHPWQWFNKLTVIFTNDIAQKQLIPLGYGADIYSAQQSIRTFFNLSHTQKHFAKTALSVINMGFMRGLSPYYMESTPIITTWLENLVQNDIFLQSKGFTVLGEVATLGYRNLLFEDLGRTIPHNKMLATLWRESPYTKMQAGENCFTMAALLHLDYEGEPFIKHLIKTSGINAKKWIDQYLQAYLIPLIHCFYAHEIVFMPHGENLILVVKNNIVERVLIKDITEEIMLFNPTAPLPEKAERIRMQMPEELKVLSIQNDVFQHFFRFLSAILEQYTILSEDSFWESVGTCIAQYQKEHPQYKELFLKYDLFSPSFASCCLNRLQLKNNKQMLNLADPLASLQFVGQLTNPIHQYKPLW